MDRVSFLKTKKKTLKTIAIILVVLLSVLMVFVIIYSRFGIAGIFSNPLTSRLLGLKVQQKIAIPTISANEIEEINTALGYDPTKVDTKSLDSDKDIELELTPQGATYLFNSMLKDKDMLENFQIAANEKGEIELSAIADVGLICEMLGEDKASIETTIGELPDKVPVYTEMTADYENSNSVISEIKVGNVKIPGSLYSSINGSVDEGLELFFSNALGIDLDGISVGDGQTIILSGSFPAP
ncbi:MAG: hypothetical protein ACYCYI_00990 [Saccharofermentanales bacterium]